MPIDPVSGEVWWADLGMAAKSRPVLVLSVPGEEHARSLIIVVPLTSQIRHGLGEVSLGKPRWLPKVSAVNVQGIASFDRHILSRRVGAVTASQMEEVKSELRKLLKL